MIPMKSTPIRLLMVHTLVVHTLVAAVTCKRQARSRVVALAVKINGSALQFLKANGSVDSNTYLTVIGSGYTFNPIQHGTTTITAGTKSYWFICLMTEATVVSGYSCYVSGGGSDNARMHL